MKKQEIANNGVTLYYCKEDTVIDGKLIPANTVFDIDVDENVHYVRIQLNEYTPTIDRIALTDCNKIFPQVTEVSLSGDIFIPNSMFPNVKTLTIGDINSLNNIYKIIEAETIILSDSVGMLDCFSPLYNCNCKCIKVDKKNPYFSSKNGLLYNKPMTELLVCPSKKTGKVTIPEGVVRIRYLAFHNAEVESIQLPSSVCIFESASFQNCRFLKEMIFTDGIVSINTAISKFDDYEDVAVCNCPKLETIVLPKTLNYIGGFFDETVMASNVIIPEGVQIIDNGALQNVTGDIKLPNSLKYIGFNNFNSVSSMTANKYIPGLLSCYDIHGFSEIKHNDIKLTIGNNVLFISKSDDTILRKIEYKASLNGLTEEILKDIDEIPLSYEEESLIINNYSLRKNEKLKEYITKESMHIGMKCIRKNDADLLLSLLKTGLVSKKRLKVLLNMSNEKGNSLISAYIMEYINQSTEQEEKDFVL